MKKLVVILTACLLLLGLSVTVAAQTATPRANVVEYEDLDYSENVSKAGLIYMGQVLENVPGISITEQEKAYIRYHYDGQNALYYTKPGILGAQHEYDGEMATLTLVVSEDYYMTSKGKEVLWTPTNVRCGDLVAAFEPAPDVGSGYYRATLHDLYWTTNVTLLVEYSSDFEVSAETLNAYVNFAYDQALILHDQYSEYEAALSVYRKALEEYSACCEEWEKYEADLDKYELYLGRIALYQDYLKYQGFLELVSEYDKLYAAYVENDLVWQKYNADFLKYQEYLSYSTQYPQLVQKYDDEMSMVQHHLSLLSYMEKEDPATGYSFIEMMIDDRIAEMIISKKTQISIIVGNGPVENIETSTRELKRICLAYQSLTTSEEKYDFYIREYASLIGNLRLLYDNIQKIYKNNTIYGVLQSEYPDKVDDLVRMLGLLYVQNCIFNDDMSLKTTTVVDSRGNQTVAQLVDVSMYPSTDRNKATPLAQWPVVPADPETYEVREQPTAPAERLQAPVYPSLPEFSYVSKADEIPKHMEQPAEVSKPVQPTKQPVHPGSAPSLAWTNIEQDLYKAYQAGQVVQREPLNTAQTVTLSVNTNYSIKLDEDDRSFFIHFYNTDEEGTYLGHSPTGVYYGEAATIPEEFKTAYKPPMNEYAYEFAGWVDENGDPLDLSYMTSDVYAYASYITIPRICTVTWDVGDAPVVQQWPYGSVPYYDGSTHKSPTAQYVYQEFLGWDKEIVAVTGDVVYTALYSFAVNRHKVTFVMGDGTTAEKVLAYGQNLSEVVDALPTPYKAADAQYTYTFVGWTDESGNLYTESAQFPTLQGPVKYTSVFEKTLNTYTVTWVVDGESITGTWLYGETPAFGETPIVKAPTEREVFTFDGWDKSVEPVTGDVTYVAQFKSTPRLYRVVFVVEDVEHAFDLEYGQVPVFDGAMQKDSDVQYDYTFIGWDKTPAAVTGEAVYTALFEGKLRKYPVTFVVEGNEITAEYEYGKKPVYPNDPPAKADDGEYCYVFVGWDSELFEVDGSAKTYTACFEAVPLAPVQGGANGKLTIGANGNYNLTLKGEQVDLSLVLEKAGRESAESLHVYFGNAVIVLGKAQIQAFYSMGDSVSGVTLAHTEHGGHAAYRLEMLDKYGDPIAYMVSELTVKLPYNGVYTADVYRVEQDGTLTKLQVQHADGYLTFATMDFATYVIMDKYQIVAGPAENGVIGIPDASYAGERITIDLDPNEGYHVDTVTVESNGQLIALEQVDGKYTFIMPEGNVQVTTTFKVVEGGTGAEVIVGVVTALLIVAIGFVIAIVLHRKKAVKV